MIPPTLFASCRLATVGWLACLTCVASGAESAGRAIARIFEPYRAEQATIARDGRRLAFVSHGPAITVTLMVVDAWGERTKVIVSDRPGARAQTIVWADSDLLLVVTDTPAFFVVDARLRVARKVLDADSFATVLDMGDSAPRDPRFVGMLPDEPGCVLVEGAAHFIPVQDGAVSIARSAAGFVSVNREQRLADFETAKLDLRTGKWKTFASVREDGTAAFLHDRRGQPRVLHDRVTSTQRFLTRTGGAARLWSEWVDLDRLAPEGAGAGFRVTAKTFYGQRSFPLCFDGDPDVLYYASNIGRRTYGIHSLNLRTKVYSEVASADVDLADPERPCREGSLVFERGTERLAGVRIGGFEPQTRWLDPQIARVQSELERKFPGRRVHIVEWDDARARFLVQVAAGADPGRYYIYLPADGRCIEFMRRAPGLSFDTVNPVEAFDVPSPAGVRLVGRVTRPRAPRLRVPPLLVFHHDGPGQRWTEDFDREAQALAAMGCIVLQLEPRGAGGLGWDHGMIPAEAMDRIPIDDTLAAMEWVATRHPFDRRRVGMIGHGFGGYVALRALALHPQLFRCAISVNAPTSLEQLVIRPALANYAARELATEFLRYTDELKMIAENIGAEVVDGALPSRMPTMPSAEAPPVVDFPAELTQWIYMRNEARAPSASVLAAANEIRQPVLLVHDRQHPLISIAHARLLRRALRRQGTQVELMEVSARFTQGDLAARQAVLLRVHEFLNTALYDFDVRIGPSEVVK